MEVPIRISGETAGLLTVCREGLYTVFEARLPPSGELTRLWVAGGGESAYLGLMEPGEDSLYLNRRLSASAMRSFPREIEYAATEEPQAQRAGETEKEEEADRQPREEVKSPPIAVPPEESVPEEPEPNGSGLRWFSRPDGSLAAFDGYGSLLALPADLRRREPGARLMRIHGRDYMVFRT